MLANHLGMHCTNLLPFPAPSQLDTLIKATIAGGGVIPHIHKASQTAFNCSALRRLLSFFCHQSLCALLPRRKAHSPRCTAQLRAPFAPLLQSLINKQGKKEGMLPPGVLPPMI